mmetsp:Transcript_17087/g.55789  ORF Transcript_17087/g.55789 Transcript_17087/m.55789 type:complete len:225 (-) Transcript_17087:125-799(-)
MMRSIVGSLARLRNKVTRSSAPFSSKSCLKKRAVSMFTPMAAKTMANDSSESSEVVALIDCLTRPACRQICAAISLCGRPAAENRGIFWPRATEFMQSMVEMPVWIISSGYVRTCGLMGMPLMSRYSSASTGGPLSMGLPEPLKMRPSMSSDTGVVKMLPVNSMEVRRLSMPAVPSNTWTTALVPWTSSTWPERCVPSASVKLTISANIGLRTFSRMTSGPLTP